ncbi:hypothetical protein BRUM_2000 [Bifidobacterium ruminantium]|uniref:Uncharacterized protein n=1 Tax=Bifidobacterium ruminantium TaxID=78346 RepID=A0A087D508_BIFRU|nr:hypothetical protein BRUM_2000 [Bifidobacterium ruminantium]
MDKDTKTELDYLLPDKAYEDPQVGRADRPAGRRVAGRRGRPAVGVAALRRARHYHQRRRRVRRRPDRREPAHGGQAGRFQRKISIAPVSGTTLNRD